MQMEDSHKFYLDTQMAWNAQGQRAEVFFSTVEFWLLASVAALRAWQLLRGYRCCTPSSSHMEDQACWICMPVSWAYDNSVWHFSFICVSSCPWSFIKLSLSFSFFPTELCAITWGPPALNCEKRQGRLGWRSQYFEFFIYADLLFRGNSRLQLA